MARRKTRRQARREGYPSDLTDAQWELVEPLLPAPKSGGRPEKHPRRLIVDAILYVVRTGCSWRQLPTDFPPWETVYWYLKRWEDAKVTEKILAAVREQLRAAEGRNPEPNAGLVDSQTVKGADTVGANTRGYDTGEEDQRVEGPAARLRRPRPGATQAVAPPGHSIHPISTYHAMPRSAQHRLADSGLRGALRRDGQRWGRKRRLSK